jgi:hypothetical protein
MRHRRSWLNVIGRRPTDTIVMVTKYDGWSQIEALKVRGIGKPRRSLAPPRVEPPSTANDADREIAIRAEMERRLIRRLARRTTLHTE